MPTLEFGPATSATSFWRLGHDHLHWFSPHLVGAVKASRGGMSALMRSAVQIKGFGVATGFGEKAFDSGLKIDNRAEYATLTPMAHRNLLRPGP